MGAPVPAARHRPVLAAVLAVLVVVVTALVVFGPGRGTDAPAAADRAGLRRTGPSSTAYALIDTRSPRQLVVYGEVDGMCAGAPRPMVRGVVAEQSPTTVTVRLDRWSAESDTGACAGLGLGPQPTTLMLAAPLGQRVVREQRSGRSVPCLDLASVPTPRAVPAGYRSADWQWQPDAPGLGTLSRTYTGAGRTTVSYVVRDHFPTWVADSTTLLARTLIDGHQASVYRRASDNVRLVIWTTADGHAASIEANALDVDGLLALARSVRAG